MDDDKWNQPVDDGDDDRQTASPYDFLNEVLGEEELVGTKKVLDDPESKELINKYGWFNKKNPLFLMK